MVLDGLYANGIYSPGSQVSSFTITSMVTVESAGMPGRGSGKRGK